MTEQRTVAEIVNLMKPFVMAYLRAEAWVRVAGDQDREPTPNEYEDRDDAGVEVAEWVPDLLRAIARHKVAPTVKQVATSLRAVREAGVADTTCRRCHRTAVGWPLRRPDTCSPKGWASCLRDPERVSQENARKAVGDIESLMYAAYRAGVRDAGGEI